MIDYFTKSTPNCLETYRDWRASLAVAAKEIDDSAGSLGRSLRGLRKARGLTLQELALQLGRSVGFISQIERGLSDPSLKDLQALAKTFDVPVSWFYTLDDTEGGELEFIVRAGSRRTLGSPEEGVTEEFLSPDLGGSFEMFRSIIEPGASSNGERFRETEEAAYIVSGQLDLWIDDEKFELKSGDSFRYKDKPYRWHNSGIEPAVLVWVVSPPVY